MKLLNIFRLEIACSLLILKLVTATFSEAQTPQYYNYNNTHLGMLFPLMSRQEKGYKCFTGRETLINRHLQLQEILQVFLL